MDLRDVALSVYESESAAAALRVALRSLSPGAGLVAAAWLPSEGAPVVAPEGGLSEERLQEIRTLDSGRVQPLAGEGAAAGPELVAFEVAGAGTVAWVAAAGSLAGDLTPWERLARAVASVAGREGLMRDPGARAGLAGVEAERDELRRRVEEGEVLHTLGLAANRSLDPDEVLELVTRLTRTALGASYVTVTTNETGSARTLAAAGLEGSAPEQDPLADRVASAGRTVRVGPEEEVQPEQLPPHREEGMQVGLGVPLSLFGHTTGALVIGYRRPVELTPRHVRLALTLAGHAAVAISNARLHRALATRTAEAERAYQELRWSAAAKERFFASLSHELRTPLNAILGYQSLILEGIAGELPPTMQQFIENSHRAAQGLLHLVNDVLDLSKIEAGKIELHVAPIDAPELLRDAVAAVQPIADQKGLRVVLEAPGQLPELRTDGDRVRQILVNLLSNAVKFTESGEVRIGVAVNGGSAGQPSFEIRVRDTGPGIPEADQERIFHEFEQIRGPGSSGGTGLGLPISRKLARLLGGELRVVSEVGAGATFVLELPLEGPPASGTWVAPEDRLESPT